MCSSASEAKAYFADPRFVGRPRSHRLGRHGRHRVRDARAHTLLRRLEAHARLPLENSSPARCKRARVASTCARSCPAHWAGATTWSVWRRPRARSRPRFFDGENVVLPAYRRPRLAACWPRRCRRRPMRPAMTFGGPSDHDCILAAADRRTARRLAYSVLPFDPAYVARHTEETVWLTEGRLEPHAQRHRQSNAWVARRGALRQRRGRVRGPALRSARACWCRCGPGPTPARPISSACSLPTWRCTVCLTTVSARSS